MNYRIRFKSLKYLWFVLFFLYSVSELWAQFNIPKEPEKIYPVNDYAQILSLEQRKALNKKLIIYNNSTSTEIILISIQNLNKEDPNLVAANWGGEWKIGQKRQDNGILVLLSVKVCKKNSRRSFDGDSGDFGGFGGGGDFGGGGASGKW